MIVLAAFLCPILSFALIFCAKKPKKDAPPKQTLPSEDSKPSQGDISNEIRRADPHTLGDTCYPSSVNEWSEKATEEDAVRVLKGQKLLKRPAYKCCLQLSCTKVEDHMDEYGKEEFGYPQDPKEGQKAKYVVTPALEAINDQQWKDFKQQQREIKKLLKEEKGQ